MGASILDCGAASRHTDVMPADETATYRGVKWPAFNPDGDDPLQILIPPHRIQWARRMGIGAIQELARSVRRVLLTPESLFCRFKERLR